MTTMTTDLTRMEATRLEELEATIERGLETFIEVGRALLEIREARLYRETHRTFEDYCRERWAMSKSYAHRQIQAAEIAAVVPIGTESQARELAPLKKDEAKVVQAFQAAKAEAEEHGVKLTAEHVRYAVRKIGRDKAQQACEPRMKPAPMSWGDWRPPTPRKILPLREIPAALAAYDRARAASDEIRLVLGPWTADGRLPDHRRVPESSTIAAWRAELANGNGSRAPSVRSIIASIERLRASLPTDSPDRAALKKALEALGEVT
jgi:hypothetical protein